MANKGIEYVLSLNATRFQAGLNAVAAKTKAAAAGVANYWKQSELGAQRAGNAFSSMQTKVAGAIAAIGGIYAVKAGLDAVVTSARAADDASFNLGASIQAANREFQVGDASAWSASIAALTAELRVYSETAVSQAAAKTIDMTKRLGLSEQQMLKVIRAAANLSAGKFELSDGVERVTAALRGEAEASEALGLTLSENYVKGWYEARGATQGAWKDLDDLQKAQIRYNVLLQQSDPFLGKAAKSAGVYGGALSELASNYDKVKTELGETITNNAFFVEGINTISGVVKTLGTDVDGNRQKWMEWSKQGALAVVDFTIAGVRAASSLYSAFAGIAGGVKETLAYYYELKASFLEGAASGAKWKDALGLTSGEAQRLGSEAQAAAAKSDALSASASKSFAEMEAGAPKVLKAAESLQQFRDQLAGVEAKGITIQVSADPAKKMQEEIVKIGNKWVGVSKEITDSTKDTSTNVAASWEGVWEQFESGALASIADVEKALQALVKDRTVTVKVQQVEGRAHGGLVGAYKFGGVVQALAAGGSVRNILRGGHLPGFGGGDRRLLLGEDGEVMLNKYAVRAAGLKAALAFNAGRWDVVMAELSRRVGSRIGYHLGGLVSRLPVGPVQAMATGGAVSGGADFGTLTLAFPGGASVPVTTTRDSARQLVREFTRMQQRASR